MACIFSPLFNRAFVLCDNCAGDCFHMHIMAVVSRIPVSLCSKACLHTIAKVWTVKLRKGTLRLLAMDDVTMIYAFDETPSLSERLDTYLDESQILPTLTAGAFFVCMLVGAVTTLL
jgi:hypothetical protein